MYAKQDKVPEFFDSVTEYVAVIGEGQREAYLQQFRRLERNVAWKQQPRLVIGVAGRISDKKGQYYRNESHGGGDKPKFRKALIIKGAYENHCRKSESQGCKLGYKLTVALSVTVICARKHHHTTEKRRNDTKNV